MRAILAPIRRVRRGLIPALGGKEHCVVALSAVQLAGFDQHCSSDGSWARCFFGRVRLARSQFACVAFAGFGNCELPSVSLSSPDAVASVTADCKFAGRAQAFGFRQVRQGFTLAGFLRA